MHRAGRRLAVGVVFSVTAAYQFAAASPARATHICHGKTATIVGTQRNDRLTGTPGPDVIAALGGDDAVMGRAGIALARPAAHSPGRVRTRGGRVTESEG